MKNDIEGKLRSELVGFVGKYVKSQGSQKKEGKRTLIKKGGKILGFIKK